MTANATLERHGRDDLAGLFEGARRVVVSKGKKFVAFDLAPGAGLPAEVADAVLGPTGNLRAPTLRLGTTWLVGFHDDSWDRELSGSS